MDELIGKRLGLYEIVSQLGTGGMANVYKAYQASVDRHVAIKVLTRLHTKEYQIFANRFMQEAQVVAKLEHPHILPVYDFGETEDYLYLVMRLVDAGTLWDRFHGQPFPLEHTRHIMVQVGDALDYAHTKGIVHRDIKPKNILMDDRDNCLLTDFGIAKVIQADLSLTQMGTTLGTPTYMSPEQIQGEPLDGRSDIYALGVILFQLATGYLPFDADTPQQISTKHLYAERPSAQKLNPELPAEIEAIIAKAMAKSPDERYATAGDMVQAMKDVKLEKSVSKPVWENFDNNDDDQTTVLPSLDAEQFAAENVASVNKVEETIHSDELQSDELQSDELQLAASLPSIPPVNQTPAINNDSQPDLVSPAATQAPVNVYTARATTPTPFTVSPDTPPQSFWQNRMALIFGVIGVLIIILLSVLIGINLSRPEVAAPAETFDQVENQARNLILEDDFSQIRLEVTEQSDDNSVERSYQGEQYVISVEPVLVEDDPTNPPRNVTFVDDQVYENFVLEVELMERSDKLTDRNEDAEENSYGITFRNQGRNFYTLEVTSSGLLKLFKVSAEEELNIVNSQDESIEIGQPIKLHLEAIGPEFTVSINDSEPYKFNDPAPEEYLKQGGIGFVVNPSDNQTATASFDNLKIWSFASTNR